MSVCDNKEKGYLMLLKANNSKYFSFTLKVDVFKGYFLCPMQFFSVHRYCTHDLLYGKKFFG